MREMIIDYDPDTIEPLLYSVDYEGGVGTMVPAEIADAPAMVTAADMVEVRSLRGLSRLTDRTGFVFSAHNFIFPTPEGGDKCTNVYGITGALRDLYIRRCIGVEMGLRAPVQDVDDTAAFSWETLFPDEDECPLSDDDTESLFAGLAAVLPPVVLVRFIGLHGQRTYLSVDMHAEEDLILRIYMAGREDRCIPLEQGMLRDVARDNLRDCVLANLHTLLEREDYHNDKVKEMIRACDE